MYKINVFLPDRTLTYTVATYEDTNGRIRFTDRKTGAKLDYPNSMCAIEQTPTEAGP